MNNYLAIELLNKSIKPINNISKLERQNTCPNILRCEEVCSEKSSYWRVS